MGIKVKVSGSFSNTERFLARIKAREQFKALDKFGPMGVAALAAATPKDSNLAAGSWDYEIQQGPGFYRMSWTNSDIENGFNVAIALQYGHGTGTGGFVHGRDYINPAMRPIFDQMAEEMWRVVTQ